MLYDEIYRDYIDIADMQNKKFILKYEYKNKILVKG